jgi:hypothetical protein
MQRIDKPTIDSLYGFLECISRRLSAGQKYRRKEFVGQSQSNYFAHLIEALIFGR